MKLFFAFIVYCALVLSRTQFTELMINDGQFGNWKPKVTFPSHYFVCGVELRNQDAQGFWDDDTSTNGIKVTICNLNNWNDQKQQLVHEGNWGSWKGMKMCPQNTYVIGGQAKYEYTFPQDDKTSLNGLNVKCGDIFTGTNTSDIMVFDGLWGHFLDMISVPLNHGVCGAQVRYQDPQGSRDDTALNSIKFLICSACSSNCQTCNGALSTACLTCKSGFSLQPDRSCAEGCPSNYFSLNSFCTPCDSACAGCSGAGPSKCVECANGYVFKSSLGKCVKFQCSAGQFQSFPNCGNCLPFCRDCSNAQTCTNCQDQYYLNNNGTSCVSSCNANQWANETTKVCHNCPTNCKSCSGNSDCISCAQGFYRQDNECLKCDSACKTCIESSKCLTCPANNVLFQGQCLSSCPNSYFKSLNSVCLSCPDHCQRCSDQISCQLCSPSFFQTDSGECASQCPQGFFPNSTKRICQSCGAYCVECSSFNHCSSCAPRFQINSQGECKIRSNSLASTLKHPLKGKTNKSISIESGAGILLISLISVQIMIQIIFISCISIRKSQKVANQPSSTNSQRKVNIYASPVKTVKIKGTTNESPKRKAKCADYSFAFLYLEILYLQLMGLVYYFYLPQSLSFFKYLNIFNGVFYFQDSSKFYLNSLISLLLFISFCIMKLTLFIKLRKSNYLQRTRCQQ